MEIDREITGEFTIYDGNQLDKRYLATIPVVNSTLPQGITSRRRQMFVVFKWTKPRDYLYKQCPILQECVKFTIMVDSATGTNELNSVALLY